MIIILIIFLIIIITISSSLKCSTIGHRSVASQLEHITKRALGVGTVLRSLKS